MPRDIKLLEDELPPDIGRDALLMAIAYTSRANTPVGNVTPRQVGEFVFVTATKQMFISVGLLNTDWQAMVEAS